MMDETFNRDRYVERNIELGGLQVLICRDCGVAVFDDVVHDNFHDSLAQTARVAREADDTASLFRPIGGGF
jgi:hypothetical protein